MRSATVFFAALSTCLGAPWPALAYDGCLGAKVTDCLDAISPYVSEGGYELARASIDRYLEGDIAGRRKARGLLTLSYHSRFAEPFEPAQLLTIDYAPSLQSSQIAVTLRKGAGTAETAAEYEATHIYETVLFALGTRDDCRELASPQAFYLFFHTRVKPRLKSVRMERVEGAYKPPSENYVETGWIALCGRSINYVQSGADWGSVQSDMNRKFSAYSASLAFR